MRLQLRLVMVLAALLVPVLAAAESSISRDDFKKYMDTQSALEDPRVQAMPAARRIPEIARVNFKMRAPALQAILEKVDAAGGPSALSKEGEEAVQKAFEGLDFKARLKEVRVDTGSAHVVTYVRWEAENRDEIPAEAVWLALRASSAAPITSTVHLTAMDADGEDVWIAKIGADRTRHVREDRIGDWAKTRYLRLFEIDLDKAPAKRGSSSRSDAMVGP